MRYFLCCLFTFCFLSALPPLVQGATYWVSTSGNDANACINSATPLTTTAKRNIAGAHACPLVPGDTIYVRAGTYNEQVLWSKDGSSWTAPLTLSAYPGEVVTLRPLAVGQDYVLAFAAASYVVINGFVLDANLLLTFGVYFDGPTHHVRMSNNEVKNTRSQGINGGDPATSIGNEFIGNTVHTISMTAPCPIGAPGLCHGFYIGMTGALLERNHVYNCEGRGYQMYINNSTVRYNVGRDNVHQGFGLWGTGNFFHNNIAYNSPAFGNQLVGIIMYSGNKVYNNTSTGNTSNGFYILNQGAGGTDFTNNISYGNPGTGIQNDSASTIFRNNLIAGNGVNIGAGSTFATNTGNLIGGSFNPQFVDGTNGDVSIGVTSSALNAGLVIGAGCTANNCSGGFTGTGPEIGAHEALVPASGASIEAAAPNTLRAIWSLAFPPIASCTAANFAIRVNGIARTPSTCTVVGSNRTDVAFSGNPVVNGNSIQYDYTAGTLRNSSDIGRGIGAAGTGGNQKVFSCTNCANVTNSAGGGGGPTAPVFGSAEVANAAPTIVKFCASTNETAMLPASPTECTGLTVTGKTESSSSTSCIRNATNNKCFDFTVTVPFAAGEIQTIAYSQAPGNITDNAASPLELVAFTGRDITNLVVGASPIGLIGHWMLDHSSGTTATDSSGNSHTGTLTNFPASPTWVPGLIGTGALSFPGTDDFVSVADHANLDITNTLTLSGWVKMTAAVPFSGILQKGHDFGAADRPINYAVETGGDGVQLRFVYSNANAFQIYEVPSFFTPGTWQHFAITFTFGTGGSIQVYKNGVLQSGSWIVGTGNVAVVANTDILAIGKLNTTSGIFLNAVLDDLRVYNTVLSSAQVQAVYAPGPVFASAVVDNGAANIVKVCTSTNDPPLTPPSGCLGFSVTGHSLTSCALSGASDPNYKCMNLTVSPAFANGEAQRTVTYDMVTGDVKSSGSGTPELLQFTANITNNVQPPCAATPQFGDASVANATPTIVKVCALTNDPPMLPPTNALGFTVTGKAIIARAINATDNKCQNLTVSSAFTFGEAQTVAYDPTTGNVTSSGNCFPELETFSGRPITNTVAASGGPTGSFAVVENASPGIVKFCATTNDPPLLPENDCALAGFTVDGHTIMDCDRTGASDPNYKCMNLAVTPDFTSTEITRTLAYNQAGGNVTSSAGGFPELVAFSDMQITNLVQSGGSVSRDQELCWIECWGGSEGSPDCHFTAQASQVTYTGGCFRVRCSIHNEGTAAAGSQGYTWYASKNGGAYAQVSDTQSAGNIFFATPPELGPVPTTEQITNNPATYTPGKVLLSTATPPLPTTGDPAFGSGVRMEVVGGFCLDSVVVAGADCTVADDWQLEIRLAGGGPLETYTVRPRVCVASGIAIHQ